MAMQYAYPWGLEVRVSGVLAQFHLFSLPTTLQGCRNRRGGAIALIHFGRSAIRGADYACYIIICPP